MIRKSGYRFSGQIMRQKGEGTVDPPRRWPFMEKMSKLVENAFMIAWDYLEATGELGEPDGAASELLDIIEGMILRGERRRILIANAAIDVYKLRRATREAGDGQPEKAGAA
jgi:hypothetical protein